MSAVLSAAALLGPARPAAAQSAPVYTPCAVIDARISAVLSTEPGFQGMYRYTLSLLWDVGRHDPSHIDILLGLDDCACMCDARLMRFQPVAGLSTGLGTNGACTVPYAGSYACKGDPSIQGVTTGPAIKFEPDESQCTAGEAGSGTFVFYSPLPPGPMSLADHAIAIKHGYDTCYGPLVGTLPTCDCRVPAQGSSWGRMKYFYR